MDQSKLYCTAPWKGITVMEQGDVKTCCVGSTVLGNLNQDNIETILKSPLLENIKRDLALGNVHPNCVACQVGESTGNNANLRQHYLKFYPMETETTSSLNVVDIRWNNKCNLACQYCGPGASSTWEEKLNIKKSSVIKPYQDDLLEWVLDRSSQLKEIMLAGGETMLMKQNYRLFARAPKDCRFSIVTNLSYDLSSLPCMSDLLSRPADNIIWNVSAENTHEQFEYVRQGASWEQMVKNLDFLIKHWPNTVSLNMVYSIFSATQIDQTYKTFNNLGINKATLLLIEGNKHLTVYRMPEAVQELCKQSLQKLITFHEQRFGLDKHFYPIAGLENILTGLNKNNIKEPTTEKEFYQKIDWHDSWSQNKKFSDLWPELSALLQTYLPK
jgi:MoaA/NifB/PqqE/SkfB family radical SAM enzyme